MQELRRQLSEKDAEVQRLRAEMESRTGSLLQQLGAKAQETTRLEGQLSTQQQAHEEAMGYWAREKAGLEKALARARAQGDMDALTTRMSMWNLRPKVEEKVVAKLRQDLAREKEANRALQHCAARLRNSQADLKKKHLRELRKQAAQMLESSRRAAGAWKAGKTAEVARAEEGRRGAEEGKRVAEEIVSAKQNELEGCRAEIGRLEKASQGAMRKIQSLLDQPNNLRVEIWELCRDMVELKGYSDLMAEGRDRWYLESKAFEGTLGRAKLALQEANGRVEAAEAEARSLGVANGELRGELEGEKKKLKRSWCFGCW